MRKKASSGVSWRCSWLVIGFEFGTELMVSTVASGRFFFDTGGSSLCSISMGRGSNKFFVKYVAVS